MGGACEERQRSRGMAAGGRRFGIGNGTGRGRAPGAVTERLAPVASARSSLEWRRGRVAQRLMGCAQRVVEPQYKCERPVSGGSGKAKRSAEIP